MAPSKMNDFLCLIGGEENLPAKLHPLPPSDEVKPKAALSDDPDDVYANLDHVIQYRAGGPANTSSHLPIRNKATVTSHSTYRPVGAGEGLDVDPRCGDAAPLGFTFCPWQLVSRFCYRFVERQWQQALATAFFDANKIWDREWDLYYVHSDQSPILRPTVLVPESQFQVVLDEINTEFPEAKIAITDHLREAGFAVNFDGLRPEHRPRFLGHSTSRAQHEHWVDTATVLTQTPDNMGEDRSLQAFKAKMAAIAEISKNKNKAKKALTHQTRLVERMEMTKQTIRAQQYLGLLAKREASLESSIVKDSHAVVDPMTPSPFPFAQEPVIIAFDVEAWEMSPHPITEIGIAILDTRDLKGVAPGRVGEEWQKHIRARHFRILEHKDKKNHRFLAGCPDDFQFGESEFISQDHIVQVLGTCFKQPFSKSRSATSPASTEPRNIILLGHDISQDINYLAQIGFHVTNRANVLEAMDTTVMYRAYTHDPDSRNLGTILADFDLTGWHLHNAGNDAVYTMWAMLAIAVQTAAQRDDASRAERLADAVRVKSEAAAAEAKNRVLMDAQGWEAGAAELGGSVVRSPPETKTKTSSSKGKERKR